MPTVIKDALKLWEEKTKQTTAEAETVKMTGVIPPVQKMDATLGTLTKVRHLSLGTNQIDRISNLNEFLTVLSLGRNNIKKIENLEPVADTLEELWLSYNQIERVNGIECCKKLQVVYLSNNKIKAWEGFDKLKDLPALVDLLMAGNPLEEQLTAGGTWRDDVAKKLTGLKRLDGRPVIRDDEVA